VDEIGMPPLFGKADGTPYFRIIAVLLPLLPFDAFLDVWPLDM
jgi:hypothetical protein